MQDVSTLLFSISNGWCGASCPPGGREAEERRGGAGHHKTAAGGEDTKEKCIDAKGEIYTLKSFLVSKTSIVEKKRNEVKGDVFFMP